jgi:hypothetical protein
MIQKRVVSFSRNSGFGQGREDDGLKIRLQLRRKLIPIPNQGAIFVGSSSAPQRTILRSRRLNPRRLYFILDLESD